MILQTEGLKILKGLDAVITDSHIVYTSGKHGSIYVNKDAVYPHTKETSSLCFVIARFFSNYDVDVVIAPALGGIILSQWVAYYMSEMMGREIFGVYAEKDGDQFAIRRGYDKFVRGKNVLVLEDIITTGGSVKKVVEAVRAIDGNVIGVGALCNRGNIQTKDIGDVPGIFSLIELDLEAWDEADCPLCAKGVPMNTDVGKGKEFLARKKQ